MKIRTLIGAVLAMPGAALAAPALETIVVTATRVPTPSASTTYTVNRLDADFLADNTRRNIPDALNLVPGVLGQKTTYGHGSPFVRGQTGRANLLLVDGVRLNNSIWRSGPVQYWNTVDAFTLENVELVKSQGSVVFGSDAIGGTLNGMTRSSRYAEEAADDWFVNGAVDYQYHSVGEGSNLGRVEGAFGRGSGWGLHGGYSYKDFGDIEDSAVGRMRHTGYDERDWDLRFDTALGSNAELTLSWQDVEQDDIWRWHRTIHSPGWSKEGHVAAPGTWVANIYDQDRSLGYARLGLDNPDEGAWYSALGLTVSWQEWKDSEYQNRRSSADQTLKGTRYQQLQSAELKTLGVDLQLTSTLGSGRAVYGLDYYTDSVDSTAWRNTGAGAVFRPASRPVADDSDYALLGLYGQYLWDVSESLRVEAGLRYTHAEADIGKRWDSTLARDLSSKHDWDNVVGSLRANLQLESGWAVFGGVSQAFRAPNLVDLSGAITSRSGIETGGSTDLDPERFVTFELGTRMAEESLSFDATAFYTDITNVITDTPVIAGSANTVATNGRDGYLWGLEAELAWQLAEQWRLSAFAAWQEGETTTEAFSGGPNIDEPYSRALPLSGSVAVRWSSESGRLWAEARLLASELADRLSAADIADRQRIPSWGTPGYVVGMLHGGWQATEHLELTLGLENLGDEDYRMHGSGNNEPGFNAIFALRASW